MNTVVNYYTCSSPSTEELDKEVKKLLNSGYTLWGNPYTRTNAGGYTMYHQAMVVYA